LRQPARNRSATRGGQKPLPNATFLAGYHPSRSDKCRCAWHLSTTTTPHEEHMLDYDTLIELHRMRDAGATISDISRTLNIARSTVMWNLRRQIPKPTDNSIV